MARMSINGAQREDGVASEIADLLVGVQQKKYRSAHMTGNSSASTRTISSIPADDLQRTLTLVRPNEDQALPHVGLVGDTYTILLKGGDTAGRYCLIDMHVPPGGGPPPHRHDFEESFIVLEGEIEATFRGVKSIVRAGETVNIPANAPHQFRNASDGAVRLLCICSPAGQEDFFAEVGVPVATRTTPPPALDPAAQAAFRAKAEALAPKYRTEFLERA
jgi:quercetin dioxygenase-like cupin family protein